MPRTLVTKQEIADAYGVTPDTVDNWIAAGHIPAYRVGPRAVRLDPDEVAAALVRPIRARDVRDTLTGVAK